MKPIRFPRPMIRSALFLVASALWCNGADYTQNFDAADGTSDFGDGSLVKGNFVFTPATLGNKLQFTTNANNNNSVFLIPAVAGSSTGWTATFDYTISDTTAGLPKEGFSFSYGGIPNTFSSRGEEGWPGVNNVLSFEIDIADNGGSEVGPAIGLNRPSSAVLGAGGSNHPSSLAFTNGDLLPDDGSVSGTATISWVPGVGASFTTTGLLTNANFTFVPTPGFTGSDAFKFAFAGRTTGANAEVLIDNLVICVGADDSDGDGLPDDWEAAYGLDRNSAVGVNGASGDLDGDTLTNLQEFNGGTQPNTTDSDGDTLADNVETRTGVWVSVFDTGTDPTKLDSDGDGLADNVETCTGAFAGALDTGSDPNLANTDGDSLDDGEEVAKGTRDPNFADDPDPNTIYEQNFDAFADNTTNLGDGSVMVGTAVVLDGALRLTENAGGNNAAFHIPPRLDSSMGFTVKFDYSINSTGNPADGFAVSYGALPFGTLSTQAEDGFPGVSPCLSFEMDTYENGGDLGPAVAVDDVSLAYLPGAILNASTTINGTISIVVKADGTSTFSSTGALNNADFRNIETGFVLLDSHSFAITARTGGAWEELFIDNIEISTGIPDNDGDGLSNAWEIANGLNPNSAVGDDGADGDPDGDGLTNAQELAAGTNPKSGDTDGDGLQDGVEDGGGTYLSPFQTGTSPINPDSDGDGLPDGIENPNLPYVDASQPGTDPTNPNTDGDSAGDGAEILVGRDPTVPDDPPRSNRYDQDFDIFPDGTRDLADNSTIGSTNNLSAAVIGGQLRLNEDGIGSTWGSFRTPPLRGSSGGFTATFDFIIEDTPLNNNPADGFAFSYGAIPPLTTNDASPTGHGAAEEGWPGVDHISFGIDTWDAATDWGVNIASEIGGLPTEHAFTNGSILNDGTTVTGTATISWNPTDGASFTTTGLLTNADFQNVPIPGFNPDDDYIFAFGSRTGGANESVFIDNLVITTGGGQRLYLEVESSGDNLLLRWDSKFGRLYDVHTSTDLLGDPATWDVVLPDLKGTPPENIEMFLRPGEQQRFYAVVEKSAGPLFFEDFESGQGDWTTGANAEDTGTTLWGFGPPLFVGPGTGADGSMGCAGTNREGDYGPNTDIWLRSPAIDLSGEGITGAALKFAQFRDTEFGVDVGSVRVLQAAAPNNQLGPDIAMGIDGADIDWVQFSADLPVEAIGQMIVLEFQFISDSFTSYSGWYIDNVEVTLK